MTSRAISSISGFKVAALMAAVALGLFALDRAAGAAIDYLYLASGASPLKAVQQRKSDTVVVGTSSAKYAIHPDAWPDRMSNLAQDGQTFLFSIAMTDLLARAGVPRIIVGIDPYDLKSGLSDPSARRISRITPLIADHPELRSMLLQTNPDAALLLHFQTYKHRGSLTSIVRALRGRHDITYRPLSGGTAREPDPAQDVPKVVPRIHASLLPYIAHIKEVITLHPALVILTVTPAYKNRRADRLDQAPLLAELGSLLAGAKVCDLTAIDTPAMQQIRSDPQNFFDGIHLTERGARIYTSELVNMIKANCQRS